ncbi:hypothetical protein K469DRAFT_713419 [Zopfia rhizophila CBS 207.26]|uniref:Uncharacterized protein n=1 Tax=Zopfia rhizophila CBS 207.26 TaxID=1314779 RepID=A0A6A6DRZ5_9PEZI|nr:hypothetical protein K469DRAFT_713419 [Zopfia rhizophila CBS 207.26]
MDIRRPTRNPNPSSRRNIFNPPPRRPLTNPLSSTTISTSSLHTPFSEPSHRNNDLVERDSSGNYSMAAPAVNLKAGGGFRSEQEEEREQENQVIALHGKRNEHWDAAALVSEIKAALDSSLERKVQSLEADRWMFEGEGKAKP